MSDQDIAESWDVSVRVLPVGANRAMTELMKSAGIGGAASGVGVGSPPGAPKVASS
ncbi:hypothetical protein DY000_02055304 [Brassica cretica]|uniref:Uncharacterized protein n=1 Tax=Brassica cretica TaxID=69181 RepID=A0ABQ7AC57_BRACR|nr:hypothetical protein DY000_02055304 [Brassica cretica]